MTLVVVFLKDHVVAVIARGRRSLTGARFASRATAELVGEGVGVWRCARAGVEWRILLDLLVVSFQPSLHVLR